LPFHQQAADELRCNLLGWAGEEGLGKVLGGRGGYGSGLKAGDNAIIKSSARTSKKRK